MPRITAGTVAEHVARQEAAVVAAAVRLFTERGIDEVTMGDIATEVGLARNSLYRYFPDKGHLLARWFHIEMDPLVATSHDIASSGGGAHERLEQWLDLHLTYLTAPGHRAMVKATAGFGGLDPVLRAEMAEGHRALYETLSGIVGELLGTNTDRDVTVVSMLVVGLVQAAADQATRGSSMDVVRNELMAAAGAVTAPRGDPSGHRQAGSITGNTKL